MVAIDEMNKLLYILLYLSKYQRSAALVVNTRKIRSRSFLTRHTFRETFTLSSSSDDDEDLEAKSSFGTKQYWDEMYDGMGDFPKDEYSWYFGFDKIKPLWIDIAMVSKESKVLVPGVGNDPLLLDLFASGYKKLTAFDYSSSAIERQHDLLSYDSDAFNSVELLQADMRSLDEDWSEMFDAVLEKGALDAVYLSGEGNLERSIAELTRVLRPGGILMTISGVVPEELRKKLLNEDQFEWIRDGSKDLTAGCFILRKKDM